MHARILCLLIGALLFAGSVSAQLERADRRYDRLQYADAIPLYEKYLAENPNDVYATGRLADSYRRVNDYVQAEKWFAQAVEQEGTAPINYFHYGQLLMNNRKYEEAGPYFEKYLESHPNDLVAQARLAATRNYEQFMEDSTLYAVKLTNINTKYAEFSPHIWNDKLIFATARNQERLKFGWNGENFLDLYVSDYDGTSELGEPERLKGSVNTKLHEAHVTISPDGNTMLFSRNNIIKGTIDRSLDGTILLKTFMAVRSGNKWKYRDGIPFNSDEYSVGHPALTPDGKTLYFVSDMPGGFGGTDLYKVAVDLEAGTWGIPENLGPAYNTTLNEMFPWVGADGTLYYSSNGLPGLGGLDLFRVRDALSGTAPQNMGYPINSSKDDFSLAIDPATGTGFFSSNRVPGVGDDDIYTFYQKQLLKGVVVDAATGERLENARVELYAPRGIMGTQRTDEDGSFRMGIDVDQKYQVVADRSGYEPTRMVFDTKGLSINDDKVIEIPLTRLPDNCPEPVPFEGTLVDEDGKPLESRTVRLIEKSLVMETDPDGKVRAMIDPAKEYEFIYDGGKEAQPLRTGVDTRVLATQDTVRARLVVPNPKPGDIFFIIYYDFDRFNIRATDARPELNRMIEFLEANPNVTVEMTAHTDSRGTDEYNQRLSKHRARQAYLYLVERGIDANRLVFRWKGETQLTNDCGNNSDCTEEQHQRNRRTEFKLTGM